MPFHALDLLLFTGAIYGLAWLVTKSKVLRRPRQAVERVPFLGELSRCIVCTATWVALGLMLLLPWSTLFSDRFTAKTPVDALVLLGWSISASWALGRLLGDAD